MSLACLLRYVSLEPEHRYAVLEMGAERVGELQGLCEQIVRPHWSVITTVGSAHLLHFGRYRMSLSRKANWCSASLKMVLPC